MLCSFAEYTPTNTKAWPPGCNLFCKRTHQRQEIKQAASGWDQFKPLGTLKEKKPTLAKDVKPMFYTCHNVDTMSHHTVTKCRQQFQ